MSSAGRALLTKNILRVGMSTCALYAAAMIPEYPYRYERSDPETLGRYILLCRCALTDAEIEMRLKKIVARKGRSKRGQELTVHVED
jgi:hypothetical protein